MPSQAASGIVGRLTMNRCAAFAVMVAAGFAVAADWPQFQGPDRNNISSEKGLLQAWPPGGPQLLWTFNNTGAGYSTPSVVGDRIYITGARGDDEYLICLDAAAKVKELWAKKIGPTFNFALNQWGIGPRSAPTVADGLVYALGGRGELICCKADKGDVVWQTNMVTGLNGAVNDIQFPVAGDPLAWGYSWSPLVDGDNLICFPGGKGGALAALDRKNGNVVWRSKKFTMTASYSSPVVATIGGVKQYVVLHNDGLTAVDTKGGDVLWEWKKTDANGKPDPYGDVVIQTPIIAANQVYISAGFQPSTCQLVDVAKNGAGFKVTEQYKGPTMKVMKNFVGGSVLLDGHVYGYSDRAGWICQNLKTGKEVWFQRVGLKAGSVIAADGNLYCYDENTSDVALVEASSTKKWNVKGKFALPQQGKLRQPSSRSWTPPVIANGCLYLRDQELLFCYKIK